MNYLRYCHTRTLDDNFILFTDGSEMKSFMAGLYANSFVILSCGCLTITDPEEGACVMAHPLLHEVTLRPLPDDVSLLFKKWPSLPFSPPFMAVV